jgi:hypothetical protein
MPRLIAVVILFLGLAHGASAASAKECMDLSASRDQDVDSASGIRVTVSARNRCQESVDSGRLWFKVKAIGNGDAVMGSQKGHFGPTVPRQGQVETKVFVVCEPAKVRSVSVEAESLSSEMCRARPRRNSWRSSSIALSSGVKSRIRGPSAKQSCWNPRFG